MPRRAAAGVRPIEPDPVYGSRLVQQIINKVMVSGKKSLSEQIVYDALEILSRRSGKEAVESLESSIAALTPSLEVRSRRVGGATYQVPVEVPARRARTLAVRWLRGFARPRRGKNIGPRPAAARRADQHRHRERGDHEQRRPVPVPSAQLGVEARQARHRPDGDLDHR